jgi:hypothetical protein
VRSILFSVCLAVFGVMALTPSKANAQFLSTYIGPPYNSMDLAAMYQYPSKIPASIYPQSWPFSGYVAWGTGVRYTAYPAWRQLKGTRASRNSNTASCP